MIVPLAAQSSNRDLLFDILKLSGPISCTTVVEFLPQILIAALVGHADPATALPSGDGDTEGAVLTASGLANLVYSTCAFSIVYGFICGLDSVAASSYGMTRQNCPAGPEACASNATDCITVPAPTRGTGGNNSNRKITWSSPALRGMPLYITPSRSRCIAPLCMTIVRFFLKLSYIEHLDLSSERASCSRP